MKAARQLLAVLKSYGAETGERAMHVDGEDVKVQDTSFHRRERNPGVNCRELHNRAQGKKGGGRCRESQSQSFMGEEVIDIVKPSKGQVGYGLQTSNSIWKE